MAIGCTSGCYWSSIEHIIHNYGLDWSSIVQLLEVALNVHCLKASEEVLSTLISVLLDWL